MLIWADGFGAYGNSNELRGSGFYNWRTNNGSGDPVQITTTPAYVRTGAAAWFVGGAQYDNWYGGKMFGGNRSTVGIGAAFYYEGIPSGSGWCLFMMMGDNFNSPQCALLDRADGSMEVRAGYNGAVLGVTDPGLLVPGAYAYIEMRVFCDAVNGSVEVRFNNVTKLLVTGVNTAIQGYPRINGFATGRNNWGSGYQACRAVSDLVIWDTTGAVNNDFIGDVRCRTYLPATDGPEQDWDTTAAPAYGEIDNVPYNGAKFISADTVGQVSNFGHIAVPINTAYIAGINMMCVASKTDAGTCEITPQLSSNGVVANGTVISPGTGYARYASLFDVDPNTGGTFLPAGFDSALMQVERTA